jgi:putative redox protein
MSSAGSPGAPAPAAPIHTVVHATWRGGKQYEVGVPGGATTTIDGAKVAGPGPVDTLLGALAACSAMDVVDYMEKRRTPAERLEIVVSAVRSGVAPRRVLSASIEYQLRGADIDHAHAERAIALAVERYCSVAASLASDIVLKPRLALNGQSSRPVRSCDEQLAEVAP